MTYEPNSPALGRNDFTRVKQILRESCGRFEIIERLVLITYAMLAAFKHNKRGSATAYPQYPQTGL
jgi:hypothetical protein